MRTENDTVSSRSFSYVADEQPGYCTCLPGIHRQLKAYFDTTYYSIDVLGRYIVVADHRRHSRETWMAAFNSDTLDQRMMTFWDAYDCHFVETILYKGDDVYDTRLRVDLFYSVEEADTFDMRSLVRNMEYMLTKIRNIELTVIPHWKSINIQEEPRLVRGRYVDAKFYSGWMSRELKRQYPDMDIYIDPSVKSGFSYGTLATHDSLYSMEQYGLCRRMKRIVRERRRVLEHTCGSIDLSLQASEDDPDDPYDNE